jgi:hypothetical protein
MQLPGTSRVWTRACSGETPKPTPETGVLPRQNPEDLGEGAEIGRRGAYAPQLHSKVLFLPVD